MRTVFYYLMPMSYLKKRQAKLSELQSAMLRHPAVVSGKPLFKVANDLWLVNEVIEYAETHKWTKKELKDLATNFGAVFLFFAGVALLGGLVG